MPKNFTGTGSDPRDLDFKTLLDEPWFLDSNMDSSMNVGFSN